MITGGAAWGLRSEPWGHSPSEASGPRQDKGKFPLQGPSRKSSLAPLGSVSEPDLLPGQQETVERFRVWPTHMSPPSKPRGAAPEEEFSDQGLKVSWDDLGAAMGSKPRSPCCGKHGTGRPGGQRKPQPDPGPWGCPACGGNRVLVPSVSHIWAALATQPGRKCPSRLVPFLASECTWEHSLRGLSEAICGGHLRSGGRGGFGPRIRDARSSRDSRRGRRATRRRPLEASVPEAAGEVEKEQAGPVLPPVSLGDFQQLGAPRGSLYNEEN